MFQNQMQRSLSQGRTQCMVSPIGLPVFFRSTFVSAHSRSKRLVIMRCKEFTYCLCNFIWPHRSRTFMFVRLRALFKSLVLIGTKN
ncbi:hypothetical protein H5410_021837 [Solanum commersonii]|uniref:Uncharacterized protein n=1 Tax=Solanum commersonii TaxID=4109 RepID=A0A9J5ZGF4_SOLCO|nr:hypothetical protein H5410_021837 [Solanum commersonii]